MDVAFERKVKIDDPGGAVSVHMVNGAWGWVFDKIRPDTYDLIGAVIILIGVSIIYYWPRKDEIND